jgi:PAS domain S-box-containing protein
MQAIDTMPLRKAVTMALDSHRNRNLEFRLRLMKDIVKDCDDLEMVAKLVVNRLKDYYKWHEVGIFRVDRKERKFRLIAMPEGSGAEEGYTQDLDEGVLGWVYKNKRFVNIPDITKNPKFKKLYVAGVEGSRSELCIPLKVNGEILWLLNLEDVLPDAFSKDEVDELLLVLTEVEAILQRAHLAHFREATFEAASDAVIVTDGRGWVRQANPALERLLGYKEEELAGKSFRKIFKPESVFDRMISGGRTTGEEVMMKTKNRSTVPVFISASPLPEEMDGVVFVGKDLSPLKRVEELEYLGKMYHELAIQTKTPLSLAFAWLKRMHEQSDDENLASTLDKTLHQLRKIKLSYDRLALYGQREGLLPFNEFLVDGSEILKKVFRELPSMDRDRIEYKLPSSPISFYADLYQLGFCLESILSYLLRFAPEEEKIHFDVFKEGVNIVFRVQGYHPGRSTHLGKSMAQSETISETLADMALGEDVIKRIVHRHEGFYHKPVRKGRYIEYRIDLPIKKGGDVHADTSPHGVSQAGTRSSRAHKGHPGREA